MGYDLYLSYSARKTYLNCPRMYKFMYVDKLKAVGDYRNTFFGIVIGKVFERFYDRKVWMAPDPVNATLLMVEDCVDVVFERERFDRSSDPGLREKLCREVEEFVPGTVDAIRKHHLLTVGSRAEVDLTVDYKDKASGVTIRMGGRADFIHSDDPDVWILDGKGTAYREAYVEKAQLIWYATQHYLKFHVAPTRLGFLYYRFPKDPIQWIEYGENDVRTSVASLVEIGQKIRLKVFEPSTSPECKRCGFRERCPEGTDYVAQRQVEARAAVTESIFDPEPADRRCTLVHE